MKIDLKKLLLMSIVTLLLTSCGQKGALFIAESEEEHNQGHFMTKYKEI